MVARLRVALVVGKSSPRAVTVRAAATDRSVREDGQALHGSHSQAGWWSTTKTQRARAIDWAPQRAATWTSSNRVLLRAPAATCLLTTMSPSRRCTDNCHSNIQDLAQTMSRVIMYLWLLGNAGHRRALDGPNRRGALCGEPKSLRPHSVES